MKKQDFYFELPSELIAQYPLENRSDSRLLVYNRKTETYEHKQFKSIIQYLEEGDLLVLNNTKVIPARLYGYKLTGGKVELLIERKLSEYSFLAHIKASKAPKIGNKICLKEGWFFEITNRHDDLFECKINERLETVLNEIGHIPLPPYITREDKKTDFDRYQTVYACHEGSVAAPTAGLHFDEELLKELRQKGVNIAYVTLHVGAGTFRPVRCENVQDHKMHSEFFSITPSLCDLIHQTKVKSKRVVAVGTTALRSLESAATASGTIEPYSGETDIFIYPGYQFKICDALITNFHLPESTLLMLVSAFIGYPQAMDLYRVAIENKYRFFSYGDASLLL
ncbi:S-adenosylmethionine:tRNA ribosyltransferase-isomerase (plasmid) [Legionella adelaidensis]|uniref:S-adenosylmethionine:tRNA ribosyltransferase-isomerase n=1 Tax=Legionella adelaidensis TaxID=45056 RepID=A0A0W0R1P3_9GAMM|nr:tRNA preQ1(34) S-adenosylmethionine ribosyltransferase-isomerase QueA [Legionella adelaidensis]KTC64941.1 S-adenosylmethionine:tRNA ribosyltransferase-isomerase [Legionella adelaidensis]VEH85624.1 S-adenosylmethionine:tRNA ribosyltransferase-isomerase [Legionella adelaidensis]